MFLQDAHMRKFSYLRLSITDVCNFKCSYCLPNGYKSTSKVTPLSLIEIKHLVDAFADMGFSKIRITGGEPTIRRDIVDIVRIIKENKKIKTVGLTTNAYRLKSLLSPLRQAGLDALNVSLDTLDKKTFQNICGVDLLDQVKESIELALQSGFLKVKINAVLLKDLNDTGVPQFLEWIKNKNISVRFIELMRTGTNKEYFQKYHISSDVLRSYFVDQGWKIKTREITDGPAVVFSHPSYQGKVGLIAPYSKDFCTTCNRLRVSALGNLRLCLFGEGDYSLRSLLQRPDQKQKLIQSVCKAIGLKPGSHFLHEQNYGNQQTFSSIGG